MISDKDIEHLAALARIEMAEEEKNVIRRDLAAILAYVTELGQVLPDTEAAVAGQSEERNILREDISLPEAGKPPELLAAAPRAENNYFKVKRIK
jgi:aspartyl-tRNA(Asn)/glutamyl-tRNA(Gln) amidotransferase subunit C